MKTSLGLLNILLGLASVAGCYPMQSEKISAPLAVGTLGEGLPCNVGEFVARECLGCHGQTPSGPMSLTSAADFRAPSPSNPSVSVAELSIQRMENAADPMPPDNMLAASATAVLRDWVAAGMPEESCGTGLPNDPLNADPTCSSRSYWQDEDEGDERMNPGVACISCHTAVNAREGREEAPRFRVAGTVYPTGHEPNMCISRVEGASVVITDAQDRVFNLEVNSTGNFMLEANVAFSYPYSAKVFFEGRQRSMSAHQDSGDCNACHTAAGHQDAPGRITLPL